MRWLRVPGILVGVLCVAMAASCGSSRGARPGDLDSAGVDSAAPHAIAAAADAASGDAAPGGTTPNPDPGVTGRAKPPDADSAAGVPPSGPVLQAAGISTGVGVAPASGPRRYSGTGFGPGGKTCAGDICVSGGLGP